MAASKAAEDSSSRDSPAKEMIVRTELHQLFSEMFTKKYIESNEYLQANVSAEYTLSLAAIMMATEVRAITTDASVILQTIKELDNLVHVINDSDISLKSLLKQEQNTLILRDISSDVSPAAIAAIFTSTNGCPVPISVRSDVGDNWFVVFVSEKDARDALEYSKKSSFNGKLVRCRLKTETPRKTAYYSAIDPIPASAITPKPPLPTHPLSFDKPAMQMPVPMPTDLPSYPYSSMYQPAYPMQFGHPGYMFPPSSVPLPPPDMWQTHQPNVMMMPSYPPYHMPQFHDNFYVHNGMNSNTNRMYNRSSNSSMPPMQVLPPTSRQQYSGNSSSSNGYGKQHHQGSANTKSSPTASYSGARSTQSNRAALSGDAGGDSVDASSSSADKVPDVVEEPKLRSSVVGKDEEAKLADAFVSIGVVEMDEREEIRGSVLKPRTIGDRGGSADKGSRVSQRRPEKSSPKKMVQSKPATTPEFNLDADFPSLSTGEVAVRQAAIGPSNIWTKKFVPKTQENEPRLAQKSADDSNQIADASENVRVAIEAIVMSREERDGMGGKILDRSVYNRNEEYVTGEEAVLDDGGIKFGDL